MKNRFSQSSPLPSSMHSLLLIVQTASKGLAKGRENAPKTTKKVVKHAVAQRRGERGWIRFRSVIGGNRSNCPPPFVHIIPPSPLLCSCARPILHADGRVVVVEMTSCFFSFFHFFFFHFVGPPPQHGLSSEPLRP